MYTPQNISDIVFEDTSEELKVSAIANGKMKFPNYGKTGILLYGPPGTGKTTLAAMLPARIEACQPNGGNSPNVQEYECTVRQNGVEFIESLQNQLSLIPISKGSGMRYIILNEVDNMTPQARTQLKSVMGMPDAVFILTTNNVHLLEQALRSRCIQISFNPKNAKIWLPRLRTILANEGISVDTFSDAFLEQLVENAKFDAREIMTQLELKIATRQANAGVAAAVASQPTMPQQQQQQQSPTTP